MINIIQNIVLCLYRLAINAQEKIMTQFETVLDHIALLEMAMRKELLGLTGKLK